MKRGKKKVKQKGGALRRPRGPSTVDKIASVASMFLSGPKPTFIGLGKALANQAEKAV